MILKRLDRQSFESQVHRFEKMLIADIHHNPEAFNKAYVDGCRRAIGSMASLLTDCSPESFEWHERVSSLPEATKLTEGI